MKKCNVCGFVMDDDSLNFCPSCGNSVVGEATVSAGESVNSDATFSPVGSDVTSEKPKKSKKKFLLIGIPVVAVVLITAIIVSILVLASGGPVGEIINAAINTVEAESFTFKADADGEKISGKVNIDFDNKDVQFVCNFEGDYYDKDLIAIYDGYLIEYRYCAYDEYEGGPYERARKYDISEFIKAFFENWDTVKDTITTGDIDTDEYFKIIEDAFATDTSDLKDMVEEHVNLEKATDAIKEAFKLLADESWLEENVGFEEESRAGVTYYSFDVDFEKVAKTTKDIFSDCLESSDADEILDEVIEDLEELDEKNYSVKAEVAIEDGYIKEATAKVGRNGNYDRATFKISDVGSTSVDTNELQEYLDKCK